jgi:hypothetical protein
MCVQLTMQRNCKRKENKQYKETIKEKKRKEN